MLRRCATCRGRVILSYFYPTRARGQRRKPSRFWRSAAAVSEMEFRNLQVMQAGIAECGRLKPGQCLWPLIGSAPADQPPYRATIRVNVLHGRKSISWAKSVLLLFTGASSETFRKVPDRVQIDITPNRQNCI
jgi:hypothetical protein